MQTALYIIWILVPLVFFLLALWSRLEQSTKVKRGKRPNQEPGDLLKQAFFVSACSLITFLLDYLFAEKVDSILPLFIPVELFQLLLLPLILYIGALMVGGSKPIRIEKSPKPSQRK